MTEQKAIYTARKIARVTGECRYIVWSPEPCDEHGQHYQVASDFDCDTFFSGAKVLFYVSPDGRVEN